MVFEYLLYWKKSKDYMVFWYKILNILYFIYCYLRVKFYIILGIYNNVENGILVKKIK